MWLPFDRERNQISKRLTFSNSWDFFATKLIKKRKPRNAISSPKIDKLSVILGEKNRGEDFSSEPSYFLGLCSVKITFNS